MMYLTKTQWTVIWMTTVACLVAWLASTNPEPQHFVMPGVLVGGLFVWQVSQKDQERG